VGGLLDRGAVAAGLGDQLFGGLLAGGEIVGVELLEKRLQPVVGEA
jgi:hypothetical protein